eukprot:TRINITY_DN2263_c0_g1_i2.p1 TRINITY_DN2263_c0_g1~~TRINITY_DN2263_c0_g1_i2.p1  ORF type:complete len:219 (+),score=83.21 TRINITY_DN2263_c0_g1_i2:26-682(+)
MDDPLELKLKLAEYESKCGELEAQVKKLKERVGSSGSADDILDLKTKLTKSESRAEGAESVLKGTKHQLQAAIEKAELLQEELNTQKANTSKAEMKVEDLARKVRLLQEQVAGASTGGDTAALGTAEKRADAMESELKGTKMKLVQATEKYEQAQEDLALAKETARKAEMKAEEADRKIKMLQGALEKANERYTTVETRLLATMKEVGSLKAQLAARI